MTIDPRLLERRKTVAEERAQRSVGRLLRFILLLVASGALIWLAFSPFLSVSQVRTAGIVSSSAHATLVAQEVVAGTPMVMIRPSQVETALEADPWIQEARVLLGWPDEVIVRVRERQPLLWVESVDGWSWRAVDGVAVPGGSGPGAGDATLIADRMREVDLEGSQLVRGAALFVDSLPERLVAGLTMTVDGGELWATVEGHRVKLGRPIEMGEKALSLTALIAEDLPADAVLILVAPTHPAVEIPTDPADEVGVTEDSQDDSSTEGEGG